MSSKVGKGQKRPDKRPARARYWAARHLERNKVRRMMRAHPKRFTSVAATTAFWREQRGHRRMKG